MMGQHSLTFSAAPDPGRSVSPFLELGAYEVLWSQHGATFKTIADLFRSNPHARPSDLVDHHEARRMAHWVVDRLRGRDVKSFGVRVHRAGEYPAKLRDARHPVELLYYQGLWDLVESRCIAIVGSRSPSEEGRAWARQIARDVGAAGWTVVSGLATGIDTVVHTTALERGKPTIAVLGTPLSEAYPRENAPLQGALGRDHLVISQIPVYRYARQHPGTNRFFFPERNITMSALTEATVIVEAGNTSGTLIQARAALDQGRKLFILESCFRRSDLTWPHYYASKGARRIKDVDQILEALPLADEDRRAHEG